MKHSQDLNEDVAEILLSEDQIRVKVAEIGKRISADYARRELTLVSVLKGSLPFMADLMRQIEAAAENRSDGGLELRGTSTESSGLVRILKDLSAPIDGRDVLLVEDIIDTGLTLNYLLRYLRGRTRSRSRSAPCSTSRPGAWSKSRSTYVGFEIPDAFVVGYGSTSVRSIGICVSWASCAPRLTSPRGSPMNPSPIQSGRWIVTVGAM